MPLLNRTVFIINSFIINLLVISSRMRNDPHSSTPHPYLWQQRAGDLRQCGTECLSYQSNAYRVHGAMHPTCQINTVVHDIAYNSGGVFSNAFKIAVSSLKLISPDSALLPGSIQALP